MATADRTNSIYDCPICCERYNSPKIISCGHSFCLNPCLRNLMQSESPSCPLCRTSIQEPPSGKLEDLPTNFALQSVVEVSAANNKACRVVQERNGTGEANQKCCVKHEEDFVVYCETCSELLCQKCLIETHNQDHDTIEVQEAVDKYCAFLYPVQQDLIALNKKSDDIFNSLKDAKTKCQAEADSVRAQIDKAAEVAFQQVRERKRELHLEVDKKEDTIVKGIEDLESKGAELSLFSDFTHGMCEKLKTELSQLDFKRNIAVDTISKKTADLLKDMSNLEKEAIKNPESIIFKPNQPLTCISLGVLIDNLDVKESRSYLSKVTDLKSNVSSDTGYMGNTLLNSNAMLFLYFNNAVGLFALYRTGQSCQNLPALTGVGTVSSISLIRMNKLTKLLIVSNKHTLIEVTLNDCDRKMHIVGSISLNDALLYQISAVTWDDLGENGYAILSDGITIKKFSFSPVKKETLHVRLEKKVKCSHSKMFHVCQFGMAICDEEKQKVRFYETTESPSTTRVITAPTGIPGGRPVCVTSLKNSKIWCVLWNQSNSPLHSCVYKYSPSFEKECLLLKVPNEKLDSFCFLDERYMATEKRINSGYTVNVSVYYIERSISSTE